MTRRQRVLVFVLAGFFGIAGIATFAWVAVTQVRGIMKPAPVTDADRRLVVTAADLAPFGLEFDPRAEAMTVRRQMDGTRILQYDYQPRRIDPSNRVFLQSLTFVQNESLTARQMFRMQKIGVRAGLSFGRGKVELAEAPELFRGGDERYVALLQRQRSTVGNLFVIRQGRIVHSVILSGMAIEDPQAVQQLLEPMLAESKRLAR